MDQQLKRGFLDYVVLAALKNNDSYGYKIIQDVSDVIEISESTLYPILKRLEISKYVVTYQETYQSRLRKYYKITKEGIDYLDSFNEDYEEIIKIMDFIVKGGIKK